MYVILTLNIYLNSLEKTNIFKYVYIFQNQNITCNKPHTLFLTIGYSEGSWYN